MCMMMLVVVLQKYINVAFLVYLIVRRLPFEDAHVEKTCLLKVPFNMEKNLNGQIGVANLHQNKTLPKEKRDQRKAQKYFQFNKRF